MTSGKLQIVLYGWGSEAVRKGRGKQGGPVGFRFFVVEFDLYIVPRGESLKTFKQKDDKRKISC